MHFKSISVVALSACLSLTVAFVTSTGCSRECQKIRKGEIKNGYYTNQDIGWKVQLPVAYSKMGKSEYDQIAQKGNEEVFGKNKEKVCTQVLLALKKESGFTQSRLIAVVDPVSIYPNTFDLLSFIKKQNLQLARKNGISYSDKDTTLIISGNEVRRLCAEFFGAKHVYTTIYQARIKEFLVLVTINANDKVTVRELEDLIEASEFSMGQITV